jgi:hypothetical protein
LAVPNQTSSFAGGYWLEGVDVPAIDCVMFADPKQSRVDIVQAAGRALRRCEGKQHGYIVVPLIVPEKMEFEQFAETTAFKQIARMIAALSTQDERIADEFRAIEQGRVSSGKIIEIEGDIPAGLKMRLGDFAHAVSIRLWRSVGRANLRPFREARAFVHTLGFTSSAQWWAFAETSKRPPDIPVVPASAYALKGWMNWKDWLGGGRTPPIFKAQPFSDARAFARTLSLATMADWKSFAKSSRRPHDIPTQPWKRYARKGWKGIDDWLGTSRQPAVRNKLTFHEARKLVHACKLQSMQEWRTFVASGMLPEGIPADPAHAYKGRGWLDTADWLGIEHRQRSYADARAFVHTLKLKSAAEWRSWSSSGKRPTDIPSAPYRSYQNAGWVNWADWLGNEQRKRPFTAARAFARSLGLKSIREWKRYARSSELPPDIPARPQDVSAYAKEGWTGYDDWLGKEMVWRSFPEARAFARSLKLSTVLDWQKHIRSNGLPPDIPKAPDHRYAVEWIDWGDWLGTGRTRPWRAKYRPFEDARSFVRSLGLSNWRKYAASGQKPKDIPSSPQIAYAKKRLGGHG